MRQTMYTDDFHSDVIILINWYKNGEEVKNVHKRCGELDL